MAGVILGVTGGDHAFYRGELGLISHECRRDMLTLRYFGRLLRLPATRLVRQVLIARLDNYLLDARYGTAPKRSTAAKPASWCSCVAELMLHKYPKLQPAFLLWPTLRHIRKQEWDSAVELAITTVAHDQWLEAMRGSRTLAPLYPFLKGPNPRPQMEPYLWRPHPVASTLAKLRSGTRLEVSHGRGHVERQYRTCWLCDPCCIPKEHRVPICSPEDAQGRSGKILVHWKGLPADASSWEDVTAVRKKIRELLSKRYSRARFPAATCPTAALVCDAVERAAAVRLPEPHVSATVGDAAHLLFRCPHLRVARTHMWDLACCALAKSTGRAPEAMAERLCWALRSPDGADALLRLVFGSMPSLPGAPPPWLGFGGGAGEPPGTRYWALVLLEALGQGALDMWQHRNWRLFAVPDEDDASGRLRTAEPAAGAEVSPSIG
jgi:hypothetical protein